MHVSTNKIVEKLRRGLIFFFLLSFVKIWKMKFLQFFFLNLILFHRKKFQIIIIYNFLFHNIPACRAPPTSYIFFFFFPYICIIKTFLCLVFTVFALFLCIYKTVAFVSLVFTGLCLLVSHVWSNGIRKGWKTVHLYSLIIYALHHKTHTHTHTESRASIHGCKPTI